MSAEAKTPAEQEPKRDKEELDKALDRALKDSFPGSDPVSVTQPVPAKSKKKVKEDV